MIFKVLGILVLAVVLLLIAIVIIGRFVPVVSRDYHEKTATGGEIEARYISRGRYEVSSSTVKRDDSLKQILVFYPSQLENTEKRYPVVVYSNGTGQRGSQYKSLYRHLSSWGFVVLANDDPESYSGLPAEKTLSWILEENEKEDSIFYGKIDTDRIGTYGHSQGGAAVFNTITVQEHSNLYKTAVSLSPTHEELADALGWHYDLKKVRVPVFIIAGTAGEFEIETVIPFEKLSAMYEKLGSPKAMERRKGAEHANTVTDADGYVTAWFMWQLQDDAEAAKAFTGDHPELLENPLYQDQRINLTGW